MRRTYLICCAAAISLLVVAGSARETLAQNTFPSSGSAGVGTASPEQLFDIYSAGADPYTVLQIRANRSGYGNVRGRIEVYAGGSTTTDRLYIGTDSSSASTRMLTLRGDGNVGIGTNNPQSGLHIATDMGNSVSASLRVRSPNATARTTRIQLEDYAASTADAVIDFVNTDSSASNWYLGLGVDTASQLVIRRAGNIGIGTTAPLVRGGAAGGLNISGTADRGIQIDSSSGNGNILFTGNTSGTGNMYVTNNSSASLFLGTGSYVSQQLTINSSGYLGIGTTSPTSRLEIVSGTGDPLSFNGTYNKFKTASGWTYLESYHGAEIVIDNGGNYSDRTFTISKGASRIGGGSPTPLLTVQENGNVNISGTINAKYQDVAEWVPSFEQLSAGTVVVLDSTKSNQVTSSSTSYDTRVAGVVSEQPGIALGEKSEGKVLVATTGRVRVKVDATKAPIHIGDLLVTSDLPGVAMKSEPIEFAGRKMHMPGTLIGKALEPLEKGKGEILVLLSLQ